MVLDACPAVPKLSETNVKNSEFAAYMFPSLPCAKSMAKGTMS
jgi:hypothetical protein